MSVGVQKVNNYVYVETEEKSGQGAGGCNRDSLKPRVISICDVYYLAHQRLPQLGFPGRILGPVQLGGPTGAVVAAVVVVVVVVVVAVAVVVVLATRLPADPPLVHPVGIYHFSAASLPRKAVVVWSCLRVMDSVSWGQSKCGHPRVNGRVN